MWKCAKTSPQTLATKELAVTIRQRTVSRFRFRRELLTKATWLTSPNHPAFLWFPDWKWSWEAAILTQLRTSRQNHRRCWTPLQNTISRIHLKNCGIARNSAYAQKGTISRMMVDSGSKVSFLTTWQHQSRKLWMTLFVLSMNLIQIEML
jgi:hypothetical protein